MMKKLRYDDWAVTIFLKVVVAIVFLWSCLFWAGVTIINFYFLDTTESHLATGFSIGTLLILLSMVLMYARFYLIQLPFCIVGSAVYLVNAGEMIDVAARSAVVFSPSFELRYMPEIAILVISIVLFMLHAARLIARRLEEKDKFNNSPARSILEDKEE